MILTVYMYLPNCQYIFLFNDNRFEFAYLFLFLYGATGYLRYILWLS